MEKVRADSLVVHHGSNILVVAQRALDAESAADKINDLLQKAFEKGIRYGTPDVCWVTMPSLFDEATDLACAAGKRPKKTVDYSSVRGMESFDASGGHVFDENGCEICSTDSIFGAMEFADRLNGALKNAYRIGLHDGSHGFRYDSPFIEDRKDPKPVDDDEAPLIDVPDGCDDPEYGPEKFPPRKEKK